MSGKIGDVVEIGTNLMELIEFVIYKTDKSNAKKKCLYGINVFKVREVIKTPEIIPLPDKIPYIEGMFNLRNENIPLLNLIERLGGIEEDIEKNIVIIGEFSNTFIGLMVHEVVQIHRVSWDKILTPPRMSAGEEANSITGVIQLAENQSLVILDLEKIVNEINPSMDEEISSFDKSKSEYEGIHIMLADDSKIIRKQMDKLLTKMGFRVTLMENGKEALDFLMGVKEEAKVKKVSIRDLLSFVITDIEMPRMDGYTLTSKIKEDKELSQLPVIMHTSLSAENVKLRGMEVGADAYITKFSVDHITETIKKVASKFVSK